MSLVLVESQFLPSGDGSDESGEWHTCLPPIIDDTVNPDITVINQPQIPNTPGDSFSADFIHLIIGQVWWGQPLSGRLHFGSLSKKWFLGRYFSKTVFFTDDACGQLVYLAVILLFDAFDACYREQYHKKNKG